MNAIVSGPGCALAFSIAKLQGANRRAGELAGRQVARVVHRERVRGRHSGGKRGCAIDGRGDGGRDKLAGGQRHRSIGEDRELLGETLVRSRQRLAPRAEILERRTDPAAVAGEEIDRVELPHGARELEVDRGEVVDGGVGDDDWAGLVVVAARREHDAKARVAEDQVLADHVADAGGDLHFDARVVRDRIRRDQVAAGLGQDRGAGEVLEPQSLDGAVRRTWTDRGI